MSDHQPIFVVHKKGRDVRQSVTFKDRHGRFGHDSWYLHVNVYS